MSRTNWALIALVTFSSFPALAQQAGANAQGGAAASGAAASQSASANASSMPMRPVKGELVGKLDSKSAKVGDPVVMKTTETARTADGAEIPKGSRIVGHVTEVQAHSSAQPDGRVAIQFDRAETKDGRTVPLHCAIESISPSAAAMAAAANGNVDPVDPGPGDLGRMGAGAGGGRSAGGMGGATGSVGGMAGSTVGNLAPPAGTSARSAANAAGGLAGNAGAAAGADSLGGHATSLPGITLAGDATGGASGTLSAAHHNVHLDGGTQMVLEVAPFAAQP